MIDACIAGLLRYAEDTGLIEADDRLWARNRLLEALQLDGCDPDCAPAELPLADLLRELTEDAVSRGVAQDNSVARDLFDTKLMGVLTPAPHEVRAKFRSHCRARGIPASGTTQGRDSPPCPCRADGAATAHRRSGWHRHPPRTSPTRCCFPDYGC